MNKRELITPGVCHKCGCTEDNPCVDSIYGPCWWVNDDSTLCSHCADETYPDSLVSVIIEEEMILFDQEG